MLIAQKMTFNAQYKSDCDTSNQHIKPAEIDEPYINHAHSTVAQRVLRGGCDERAMDGERRS